MSEASTKPSRSQFPPAARAKGASRAARRRTTSQSAQCAQVIARCQTAVGERERAFYEAQVSDEAARRLGMRYSAATVVGEWLTVTATLIRSVLAGRVAGYGPLRLRYAAELAHELALKAAPLEEPEAPAAEPTPVSTKTELTRKVARGLRNLGFDGVSAADERTARATARSLEQLAEAVQRARATVPADVLADAGLSAEVIETLFEAARVALEAHTTSTETRAQELSEAQREDVLIGRLVHETRTLLASARESRKGDAAVPQARSKVAGRAKKRAKKPAAKPPVTPPAPPDGAPR